MQVFTSISDFRSIRSQFQGTLGLVPTMGSLHRGHMALVRQARLENETLAVSIFVNPSQFGLQEDFDTYPRELEKDLALLKGADTDLVLTPAAEEVYPPGFNAWVDVGDVAHRLEGEQRPYHFRGVATVVAKLFNIVNPQRAYFGCKDGQQLVVIRQMVAQLELGVEIVAVPTVREADGLALSSRNIYLDPERRAAAPVIYRALQQANHLWERGETKAGRLREEVLQLLAQEPLVDSVDYASVADASTLAELETVKLPAIVLVAVRMGKTRLIDNILLE